MSKSIDPGAKRNFMIIGGVLLVAVIASVVLIMPKSPENTVNPSFVPTGTSITENSDGVKQAGFNELALKAEQEKADQAKARGESYIPKLTVSTNDPGAKPGNGVMGVPGSPPSIDGPNDPILGRPLTQAEREAMRKEQLDREKEAAIKKLAEAEKEKQREDTIATEIMNRKAATFAQLQEGWKPQESVVGTEVVPPKRVEVAQAPVTQMQPQQTASNSSSQGELVYQAGQGCYISIDMSINTDEPSAVFATVLNGKVKGSTMIGAARKNPNDTVTVEFDKLSMPGKKQVAIKAIVINPDTGRAALTGDVNHKIMARFVLPVLATAAGTYAAIVSRPQTTMTTTGAGMVTSAGAATTSQIQAATLAAAVQTGATVVNKNAAQESSVELPSNISVEVKFVQDLIIQ